MMFENLFERFFRRRGEPVVTDAERLAWQAARPGPLPPGMIACVLRDGQLMATASGGDLRFAAGEIGWLLPADDVTMDVTWDGDGSQLAARLAVRFQTDPTIAVLLRERTALRREELATLLTSELAGLTEMLGYTTPESLTGLDDAARERLRAKLSLMLQTKGLRCTGLEAFRPSASGDAADEAAVVATAAEQTGTADESPSEPPAADRAALEPVLAAAIAEVQNDQQWEDLAAGLEASGMPLDESLAEELDRLGQSVVGRQIDATEAARRISHLAEAARCKAGVIQPDLRHWQGLALRMRLLDNALEHDKDGQECSSQGAAGRISGGRSRRPWTWWMLRRSSVDRRLRQFLQDVSGQTRVALDHYRGSLHQISTAASVKELSDRFRLVEDLLTTVPTISPPSSQYRLDRDRLKQAVQDIQRAVTAVELAQAAVHGLSAAPEGAADWQAALTEATTAVHNLDTHLRARRQLRTN